MVSCTLARTSSRPHAQSLLMALVITIQIALVYWITWHGPSTGSGTGTGAVSCGDITSSRNKQLSSSLAQPPMVEPVPRNSPQLRYLWHADLGNGSQYIWFALRNGSLGVSRTNLPESDNRVWQMMELIAPVLPRLRPDGDFVFCASDNQLVVTPPPSLQLSPAPYLLGQSGCVPSQLLPYSSFASWSKFKIPRFREFRQRAMYHLTTFSSRNDTLFWRGNPGCDHRSEFLKQAKRGCANCDIWSRAFASHEEHAQYKFLLDMHGTGASGRLAPLFSLGAVVFYVSRPACKKNFYEHDPRLQPWKHYVPVNPDASDLNEHLARVRNDPELAQRIATDSFLWAWEVFSQEALDNHTFAVMDQYTRLFGTLDEELKTDVNMPSVRVMV